jgi:hypothetical protein
MLLLLLQQTRLPVLAAVVAEAVAAVAVPAVAVPAREGVLRELAAT